MTTFYPHKTYSALRNSGLFGFLCLSVFSPLAHTQDPEQKTPANNIEYLRSLSLEQLLEVKIITAGKTEQKAAEIPASVVVITRQDIETQGWRTLDEVLQNIPGLYAINQYYHEGPAFGMRGFWNGWANRQLMILVDGVNQLNEYHGNYILPAIAVPVTAIEKIEVIRGAMSAIYGSGAAFGVINIITASSTSDKPVQSISFAVGNHNAYQSALRLTGQEGKFYYTTNLSHYHANPIDAPLAKVASGSFWQQNQSLFAPTMDGLLENTETFFNFNGNFRDLSVLFSYVETNQKSALGAAPPVETGQQNPRRVTTFGVGYEHQLRDDLKVKMRVHYLSNLFYDSLDTFSRTFGGWDTIDYHSLDSELNLFWQPNSKWQVTTGLNHYYLARSWHISNIPGIGRDNQVLTPTAGDHPQTLGLFGQATYQAFDSLKLVAGLRLHKTPAYQARLTNHTKTPAEATLQAEYAEDKVRVIPRVAAIWQPTAQRVFKLLYGESTIDVPLELNALNLFYGNPLKPEQIKTLELVYTENFNWVGLTASLFHNQLDNLIVRDIGIADPVTHTEAATVIRNTGKENTTGLEFTLQMPVTKKWQVEVSSSYQQTDDKLFKLPAAYSPQWLGYWKTSYQLTKGRTLAVSGHYVGEMLPLYDPLKKARIGDTADGYVTWDANLRWENLLLKGAFLNLRISNLLDKEIRYPVSPNNPWAVKGTIGESRAFWLSLGLKW
jgi:outer membrane receptor protein involved in Fe transport